MGIMEGLIVKQPFASHIIEEKKEWELRSRPPPEKKINKDILLLSSGYVFGKIKIVDYWIADKKELEKNKKKHLSETNFLDIDHTSVVWKIVVTQKYQQPRSYNHPTGARIWVNDVNFGQKSLITNFI